MRGPRRCSRHPPPPGGAGKTLLSEGGEGEDGLCRCLFRGCVRGCTVSPLICVLKLGSRKGSSRHNGSWERVLIRSVGCPGKRRRFGCRGPPASRGASGELNPGHSASRVPWVVDTAVGWASVVAGGVQGLGRAWGAGVRSQKWTKEEHSKSLGWGAVVQGQGLQRTRNHAGRWGDVSDVTAERG